MINVSSFFDKDASDLWFTTDSRLGSVHEKLKNRGFTIIDRVTLNSDYHDLQAPVCTVNLSYYNEIPAPDPRLTNTFIMGRAFNLNKTKLNDMGLNELLSDWMQSMPGKDKYVMSLFPKSYLLAKSDSINFDDIWGITREWGIDCFIGVFDDSQKMMFVFAEEYGVVYLGFDPSMVPNNFAEVSTVFDGVVKDGFVDKCRYFTSGDPARLEEYYRSVIVPFV